MRRNVLAVLPARAKHDAFQNMILRFAFGFCPLVRSVCLALNRGREKFASGFWKMKAFGNLPAENNHDIEKRLSFLAIDADTIGHLKSAKDIIEKELL